MNIVQYQCALFISILSITMNCFLCLDSIFAIQIEECLTMSPGHNALVSMNTLSEVYSCMCVCVCVCKFIDFLRFFYEII